MEVHFSSGTLHRTARPLSHMDGTVTEAPTKPLAVYRIMPPFRDNLRTVLVEGVQLARWQYRGDPADFPQRAAADWQGPPEWQEMGYPSISAAAPVFSRRVADRVREHFDGGGTFVPVDLPDMPEGAYELYVAERVVDCLDHEQSSEPLMPRHEIERAVFRPDALPLHLPAFRVPGCFWSVYWNGWATDLLRDLIGEDNLELRLVWSTDPEAKPHRAPMGF